MVRQDVIQDRRQGVPRYVSYQLPLKVARGIGIKEDSKLIICYE